MEKIFEAASVEEAKEAARAELGADTDITFEIISMGQKKSLFHKGEPAQVKAVYEGTAPVVEETVIEEVVETAGGTVVEKTVIEETVAEEAAAEEPASGEKVDLAVEYFKAVAAAMGVTELTVEPVRRDGVVILKVDGPKVGSLIGRRGETMENLSYLMGLAANRIGGDYEKFGLDVAGYREKREDDLVALAKRVGEKVAKTGRSYMFEPMNPYERRIIHSTIGQMENVTSESTGEGPGRRVVVKCTGENALPDKPRGDRGPRREGRGGPRDGRGPRRDGRGPRRDGRGDRGPRPPRDRGPRPQPTGDTPVVPARRAPANLDGDFDLPLYGKIEF